MKFLIAFGTDDGKNLNNDHVGMADYFYVYEFNNGKEELVAQRKNGQFKGDETMKHFGRCGCSCGQKIRA